MAILGGNSQSPYDSILGNSTGVMRAVKAYGLAANPQLANVMLTQQQQHRQQQALQGLQGKIPQEMIDLYQAGMLPPSAMAQALGYGDSQQPANVQEWQYYSQLPEAQQKQYLEMKRSQNPVNMGGYYGAYNPAQGTISPIQGGQKTLAPNETLPYMYGASAAQEQGSQDVRAATEPQLRSSITQAEVLGKAQAEREVNAPKTEMKQEIDFEKFNNMVGTIDDALNQTGMFTSGFLGSMLRNIPGTEAKDLDANLTTIKANLGFDRLQQMRDASPTGGALGQVAIQELQALQASIKSLDQSQSPAQLGKNLIAIKDHYENWKAVMAEYYGSQGAPAGDGWSIVE